MAIEKAHSQEGPLQATPPQFVGEGQNVILLTPDAPQRLQQLASQTPIVIVSDFPKVMSLKERRQKAKLIFPRDAEYDNHATGRKVKMVNRARDELVFHSANLRTLKIMPHLKELVANAVPLYENMGEGKHWRSYGVAATIDAEAFLIRLVAYESVNGHRDLDILYDAQISPRKIVEGLASPSRSPSTNGDARSRSPSEDELARWWSLVKATRGVKRA